MQCEYEYCRAEFVPTRSDARYCSGRCRTAVYRARRAADIEAAAIAARLAAAVSDAEKISILEACIVALVEEYDAKLMSEAYDQPREHRIPFIINRLVRQGRFELPGDCPTAWPVKRVGWLTRLGYQLDRWLDRRAPLPGLARA